MSPTRQHSKLEVVRRRRAAASASRRRVLIRYEPCAAEIRAALYGSEADRLALPAEYIEWLAASKGEELTAERIRGLLFGRSGGWDHQGQPAGEPGEGDVCVHVEYVEAEEFAKLQGQDGEGPILVTQYEPELPEPRSIGDVDRVDIVTGLSQSYPDTNDSGRPDTYAMDFPEGVTEWPPDPEPLVYHDTLPEDDDTGWPQRCPKWWFGSWPPSMAREAEARSLLAQSSDD